MCARIHLGQKTTLDGITQALSTLIFLPPFIYFMCICYYLFCSWQLRWSGPAASTTEPVQELSGYSPGSKPNCYSLGWRCQRCHCYQCFSVAFGAISECNLNLQEDKALVVFAKCIAQSPGPYYSHSWWDTISTPSPSAAQDGGLELSVFLEYSWDVGNKPHCSSRRTLESWGRESQESSQSCPPHSWVRALCIPGGLALNL